MNNEKKNIVFFSYDKQILKIKLRVFNTYIRANKVTSVDVFFICKLDQGNSGKFTNPRIFQNS